MVENESEKAVKLSRKKEVWRKVLHSDRDMWVNIAKQFFNERASSANWNSLFTKLRNLFEKLKGSYVRNNVNNF